MNINHHLDKKLQFDYLINNIRSAKRFSKWSKKVEIDDLEVVKTYYSYNDRNAKTALSLLSTDQLKTIKEKLEQGGVKR
jgi:hypothetical protein